MVRYSRETHETTPVLVFGEEFEWTSDVLSKGVVEMERIGWKGLPQLVYFSFTCLRSDNRVFPSSWDIIFLSLFLHFWNQLFGLINLLKNFYFISFEALSKQHVWNFRWLRRGWMRWRGPTRELTQFDLVSGHQECLGLPQLLMTWRKMIWTSKVDPVWEYGLASGYKMCLTCPIY